MKSIYAASIYALTLVAISIASIQTLWEERRQVQEVRMRIASLATGIEESVRSGFDQRRPKKIERLVERLRAQSKLTGVVLCAPRAGRIEVQDFADAGIPWQGNCQRALDAEIRADKPWTVRHGKTKYLLFPKRLEPSNSPGSTQPQVMMLMVQDLSGLRGEWLATFARTTVMTILAGLLLLALIASQARQWVRSRIRRIIKRQAASKEAAAGAIVEPLLKASAGATWLKGLRDTIGTRSVTVIANREPYIHRHKGDAIEVVRPASGLVTALEPILRNCGGLWVAHGSGNADREVADAQGEVAVPPANPTYRLRRIWLTPEEEEGYYYGFSNEGLWPLCHHAHNRPTFRLTDWEKYKLINRRFAEHTPEKALVDGNLVLVQDYHFALLPRMLKERSSAMRIGLFWHIPWPNPEAFGICPWSQELLEGMLGSDVIGFHTQYHCNNFLETCDRYLEARIDWENFSVTRDNHETLIRAFPIGIDTSPVRSITEEERVTLKQRYGIKAEIVAVGVDRLDYTKGLVERVESVERFLEKNPQYVGRFTLAQMGSPSRTTIPAYRELGEKLQAAVDRVNARFGSEDYQPVMLLAEHHEWKDIQYYYQLGDVCLVTSLHDGMNLVAKEYVWCQAPERGSLVLSKFAGASRELTEAFIINPYSTEEMADALLAAVELAPEERARRMRSMRAKVEGHNAFHWAQDLIKALASEVKPVVGEPESVPPAPEPAYRFPFHRKRRPQERRVASAIKTGSSR